MGRYIKKTGQTTPVNAVVENTWSGSTVNAPSVAMVQDALVGENMLINSDFRHGAINQKGQTSYNTRYQYGIDMWYQISTGTLTVNDDSITSSADLKFWFDEQPENGDYTVAISVDGTLYTYTFEDFTGTSKTHNFSIGGNTLGVEMLTRQFILYMNSRAFNVDFVKLEKGKHYTGMPVWNKATELTKCYRNMFVLGGAWGNQFSARSDNNYVVITIQTPVELRKTPTIKDLGSSGQVQFTRLNSASLQSANLSAISGVSIDGNFVQLQIPIGSYTQFGLGQAIFTTKVCFDSNDY